MKKLLTWKRCRPCPVADLRRWHAAQLPLAIVEIVSRYGLGTRWLAVQIEAAGEYAIGRHRTRQAAVRTCERVARIQLRRAARGTPKK